MSKLEPRGKCGKPISGEAVSCPHCGAITEREQQKQLKNLGRQLPCHICGELLYENKHRIRDISSTPSSGPTGATTTIIGNSASTTFHGTGSMNTLSITHVPCPKCGEPKPLRLLGDIPIIGGLLGFFGTILFFVILLGGILYAMDARSTSNTILFLGGTAFACFILVRWAMRIGIMGYKSPR